MKASNWIQQQQKWVYFSIVSTLCIALLFVSIPFKAQFQYDYRLGQVWLEDDLIAPTDFALPKSTEKLEEDRQKLITDKDLYYNYSVQIDNWRSTIDSILIPEAEFIEWQRRGVVLIHPSENHKVLLSDGCNKTTPRRCHSMNSASGIKVESIIERQFFIWTL